MLIWFHPLTHRGRVAHTCVGNLTIIGSDNGLSSRRRQAIIWTNAGKLLIEPLETILSEISFAIQTFSSKKMYFKMSSKNWRPFCLGLNVLRHSKVPWDMTNSSSYCVIQCIFCKMWVNNVCWIFDKTEHNLGLVGTFSSDHLFPCVLELLYMVYSLQWWRELVC